MNNQEAKKLFKIAAAIYIASFFIFNWSDVSWVFNYRTVFGLVEDFFNPYPSIDASTINPYFYPNRSKNTTEASLPAVKISYTEKRNIIEIPKISIEAPIIFSSNPERSELVKDLDKGAVFYPGSVYPGQAGQMIVLGHSAPLGWPKIKHDWVFSDLEELSAGDKIMIHLNNRQYTYIVTKKTIIQRGADIPRNPDLASKNVLTLISCWPPGKDYQRIAVDAELLIE